MHDQPEQRSVGHQRQQSVVARIGAKEGDVGVDAEYRRQSRGPDESQQRYVERCSFDLNRSRDHHASDEEKGKDEDDKSRGEQFRQHVVVVGERPHREGKKNRRDVSRPSLRVDDRDRNSAAALSADSNPWCRNRWLTDAHRSRV